MNYWVQHSTVNSKPKEEYKKDILNQKKAEKMIIRKRKKKEK